MPVPTTFPPEEITDYPATPHDNTELVSVAWDAYISDPDSIAADIASGDLPPHPDDFHLDPDYA